MKKAICLVALSLLFIGMVSGIFYQPVFKTENIQEIQGQEQKISDFPDILDTINQIIQDTYTANYLLLKPKPQHSSGSGGGGSKNPEPVDVEVEQVKEYTNTDLDGDGDKDLDDLGIKAGKLAEVSKNYKQQGENLEGDMNNDGKVDINDLGIVAGL